MIIPPEYQTAMAFWVTLNDLPGFHCPNHVSDCDAILEPFGNCVIRDPKGSP